MPRNAGALRIPYRTGSAAQWPARSISTLLRDDIGDPRLISGATGRVTLGSMAWHGMARRYRNLARRRTRSWPPGHGRGGNRVVGKAEFCLGVVWD
ncbi:hypothetical protein HOY82DRAFT_556652 [Tuber indicum]|nr:hypothetical protein HOY82DRAFT_556652 [Tuber indicum]